MTETIEGRITEILSPIRFHLLIVNSFDTSVDVHQSLLKLTCKRNKIVDVLFQEIFNEGKMSEFFCL